MANGGFTAMQADSRGGIVLLAGFLLLVPGLITDFVALLLLIAPLRRALGAAVRRSGPPPRADGVVDLEPEQWRRVDDPALTDRQHDGKQT
jgi:UPF0716 protein FxsA